MTVLSSKALKRIVKEMTSLQQAPLEDIQVIANEENLTEIQAWIRGPDGTPYEEGYFKVRLVLDESFPDTPPKGYFMTKIFHPNVSAIGEICVNTLKKDWKSELGIEHVLLTIKCLLIVPNPESALNEEAGKLLLEQYDDYAKRARLYTSIQAKSGKNEFMTLLKSRLPNDEENKVTVNKSTLEEKSHADSTSSSGQQSPNTTNTVLKPLSNTSPTTTTATMTKKRTLDNSTMDQEQQNQQQDNDLVTKKVKKNNGKKKSLRRL